MTEWPLIVFTVGLQLACGLSLAATLFDLGSLRSKDAAMRRVALAIFPLTVFGLIASLFHLGRPLSALRALSNLGSSRLSLEVLLSAGFALAALAYSYLWWKRIRPTRILVGVFTTLVGLAAVVSSFSIYMIPSQPAWHSGWLPISFVGTLLLFAGVVPASLIEFEDKRFLRILLGFAFAGGVALLVSITWMIAALTRFTADDFSAARLQAGLHLLTSNYSFWFGSYLFLAILLPFAFALRLWPRRDSGSRAPSEAFSLKTVVFLAVLCGAIIGRMLMYAVGTAVSSF